MNVGFQESDWQHNLQHDIDVIVRHLVFRTQSIIEAERYSATGLNFNQNDDIFFQAFREVLSCFRHLTEAELLSPYKTQK